MDLAFQISTDAKMGRNLSKIDFINIDLVSLVSLKLVHIHFIILSLEYGFKERKFQKQLVQGPTWS